MFSGVKQISELLRIGGQRIGSHAVKGLEPSRHVQVQLDGGSITRY